MGLGAYLKSLQGQDGFTLKIRPVKGISNGPEGLALLCKSVYAPRV
jgi:hypothetical protein